MIKSLASSLEPSSSHFALGATLQSKANFFMDNPWFFILNLLRADS
jgi:hypothetical protein